ncbi:MAG: ATP-binding protein [Elainellaceae cyanobacterium]
MSAELIQDLIIPVPICGPKDPLTVVIDQLSSAQEDWLLIWDVHPIGALPIASLSCLLASMVHQLLQASRLADDSHHATGQDVLSKGYPVGNSFRRPRLAEISLFQSLQAPVETLLQRPEIRQRLEPLQLIPVTWSMPELQAHFDHCRGTAHQVQWVVVDVNQRPLGLLKPFRTWSSGAVTSSDASNNNESRIASTSRSETQFQSKPEASISTAFGELNAQNVDLLQACQLKNDYLAYISHEMKNPITAMLGLSELLADFQPDSLRDGHGLGGGEALSGSTLAHRQQRYIKLIRHNSLRLAAIASDVLDLSRIELGHLQLSHQAIAVSAICDRAWWDARHYPARPTSMPQVPEAVDLPLVTVQPGLTHVVADEQRLLQMLTQLLANAHTSTASSGQVGVAIEAWGKWCAITIWDNGVGIPPEHQPLLLQTLQALENPRTHSLEGTGLGLVLTQRLAERHGGDLTFLSAPGKNEFTVLLPLDDLPAAPPLPHDRLQAKPLAVVAETTVSAFTKLAQVLKENGYGVVAARSGTEALKKVRQLAPDVVLLNPSLPLLSGWDVLALLKADIETQHIPIILSLTSLSQSTQSGQADAVLSPDSPPSALAKTVASVVNLPRSPAHRAPQTSFPQRAVSHSPTAAPPSLTVLYFNPASTAMADGPTVDFNDLLHPYGCRVLEVDDPEQGNLVTQVWKPDVVLLGLFVPADVAYLKQLGRFSDLALLPMVVIDPAIAAAGHQAGLPIYPCLISAHALGTGSAADMSLLVQVLRVAAQVI